MEIKKMKIEKLIDAEYNPRKKLKKGNPEYEKLKKSIEEFGLVDPIIWNKRTNRVVGGHQRITVMRDLNITEAEVSVVDLDETKEKILNIALNKIMGEWDVPALKNLLVELDTGAIDIELTGFSNKELERLFTEKPEIMLDQAVQLMPQTEYIVIVCENAEEWEKLKDALKLPLVRRGGYKPGSVFDDVGTQRVVKAKELFKRFKK